MTRSKKNTVTTYSQDGMLRVRFRFQGRLIRKALGLPDLPEHRIKSQEIAAKIQLLLLTDNFNLNNLDAYIFNKPLPGNCEKAKEPKKKYKPDSPKRRPYDSQDLEKILNAIKTDQFSNKHSAFKHSFYYPYFLTLACTGCRPAEIIGLRWGKVNLEKREIEISEVLARKRNESSASKSRIRKGTKNEKTRFIPMNQKLYDCLSMLVSSRYGDDPDELVFKAPKSTPKHPICLDDHNLNARVWKPVIEGLGLKEYHVMYSLRHGVAMRGIDQGFPITELANILGNNPQTMVTHYLHKKKSDRLPDL